jgi:hypothetical protein
MTKIVVDNTSPEGQQRQREAQVQVAFANMAADLLEYIAGGTDAGNFDKLRHFYELHTEAEAKSLDPDGIAIKMPMLERKPGREADPDDHINTTLRGALRIVAAMLKETAKDPGKQTFGVDATGSAAYRAANAEFSEGIEMIMKKLKHAQNRDE